MKSIEIHKRSFSGCIIKNRKNLKLKLFLKILELQVYHENFFNCTYFADLEYSKHN